MAFFSKWFSVLLVVLASWQSQATPSASAANSRVANGARIYQTVCANCHETGVPKAPTRSMLGFMSPSAIYHALTEGVMAPRVPHLSLGDKKDVAEFLTGATLTLKDEETLFPRCAVSKQVFDWQDFPTASGWGVDLDNRRKFTPQATDLTPVNVANLKLAWAFGFPDAVRARSHPASGGGAVFVGSQDGRVFALDKESGCVRWIFRARAEVRTAIVLSAWEAPSPEHHPSLYFGDYLGNVYRIDAVTGELHWQLRPDTHPNATITGSPTLYNDVLYVPISSLEVLSAVDPNYACCTFQGAVVALEAETGELLWRTSTIPQKPQPQAVNSAGAQQMGPSGAPIWNSPAIDPKRNQLLIGTGENYSAPATSTSDAIMAMDLDSGAINWVFQATTDDIWNAACESATTANCPEVPGPDYDFGAPPLLVTNSQGDDLVVAGQKSGIVWALDAATGEMVWKRQVSQGGIVGGIHFGMAANDQSVFVPISDAQAARHHKARTPNPGVFALDIDTGEYQWQWQAETGVCGQKEYCMPGNGAAIVATDELVLAGSLDGFLRLHDAATGKVIWKFDTAQRFESVNGVTVKGGALEGGASALLTGSMMFVNSGYFFNPYMPGNAFLAFKLEH